MSRNSSPPASHSLSVSFARLLEIRQGSLALANNTAMHLSAGNANKTSFPPLCTLSLSVSLPSLTNRSTWRVSTTSTRRLAASFINYFQSAARTMLAREIINKFLPESITINSSRCAGGARYSNFCAASVMRDPRYIGMSMPGRSCGL